METLKLPLYAKIALALLAVVLVCGILSIGSGIFIPLFFGLLCAILLYPLNKFVEGTLRLGRTLSPLVCVAVFAAALVGFVYFLAIQLAGFSEDFPALRKRFFAMMASLQHWMHYKLHMNNSQQTEYLNRAGAEIMGSVTHSVSGLFVSVSGLFILVVFVFIFTYFMLYYRRLLVRFCLHLFSEANRPKVYQVIVETKRMIYAYVFGLVIEMAVISVVNCTMFLVMGLQYAVLLGLMAAVLNIIPYLGIYTSIAITFLVTFANSNLNLAVEAALGLFVVHLLDSNIFFPRVVGGRVKMNPFITILAVVVGEFIWGIPGMFLFIPITGMIKLVCEKVEGLEAWALLIGVEDK